MRRGTTPTHTFDIPMTKEEIRNLRITYAQNGKVVLEKKLDEVTIQDEQIVLNLTQEETLKFKANVYAYVQIRILTNEEKVFSNAPETIYITETFNE